jgi:hypothetical protein
MMCWLVLKTSVDDVAFVVGAQSISRGAGGLKVP